MTKDELIAELEQTTSGANDSRKLDIAVADEVFGKGILVADPFSGKETMWYSNNKLIPLRHYTISLDAARSLSNWVLLHLGDIGADGLPYAVLGDPSQTPPKEATGIGATIELALCIAGVKAHG